MNKRYNDLIKAGYSYTGVTSRGTWDKEEVVIQMNERYKVMGNKIAVVQKVDVSPRRGGGEEKYYYWVGLVLKSEAYIADEAAKNAARRKAYREADLRKMADGCSLEELAWMMKDKLDRMNITELAEELRNGS